VGPVLKIETLGSQLVVASFENLTYLLYCASVQTSHSMIVKWKIKCLYKLHTCVLESIVLAFV